MELALRNGSYFFKSPKLYHFNAFEIQLRPQVAVTERDTLYKGVSQVFFINNSNKDMNDPSKFHFHLHPLHKYVK